MSDIVLKIENLSKEYRLGVTGTGAFKDDIKRLMCKIRGLDDPFLKVGETNDRSQLGSSDYVYALNNICFKVAQGECVGIIGSNGAGKSTLLKILSKVTGPTAGEIKIRGRIGSLLEVGTGFHPELTGRENIYMNGTILGMSRNEVNRKLDEIVAFAGVERYLDTPVKRYSSGMIVRLGFAVAAHLEPDILIVDEVLAVGDAEFQRKAIGKMQEVSKGHGRTILFVSHNMNAVRKLCDRGILLSNGNCIYDGNVDIAISKYLKDDLAIYSITKQIDNLPQSKEMNISYIKSYQCKNDTSVYYTDEDLYIELGYELKEDLRLFHIYFDCYSEDRVLLFQTLHSNKFIEPVQTQNKYISKAIIPANLMNEGVYYIEVYCALHKIKRIFKKPIVLKVTYVKKGSINQRYLGMKSPGKILPDISWTTITENDK